MERCIVHAVSCPRVLLNRFSFYLDLNLWEVVWHISPRPSYHVNSNVDHINSRHQLFHSHWGRDEMVAIYANNIFKCIVMYENYCTCILIKITLKFVPFGLIHHETSVVPIMAWCPEAATHYLNKWWLNMRTQICVTRPEWFDGLE